MKIFCLFFVVFLGYSLEGKAAVSREIAEDSYIALLCSSTLPEAPPDQKEAFISAYLQGALKAKYPNADVTVSIRKGVVMLSDLPTKEEDAQQIIAYVQDITKETKRQEIDAQPMKNESEGIWFPQTSVLFPTQVANPRQPTFSGGLRVGDCLKGKMKAPVNLGAQFPIYRWMNVMKGDLQLEVECCAFSLFNLFNQSNALINADYYVGLPVTYAKDKWRGRARIYHISSHVGDEFLLRHHNFKRKNKSFEAIDFSGAYYVLPELYFFGTLGSILLSDKEMPQKPLYLEYGFEVRGEQKFYQQLYRRPFLSVFMRNAQEVQFKPDLGLALGYEWGKIQEIGRCFRAFLEFHDGFLPDGQFSHRRCHYAAFKISYGF